MKPGDQLGVYMLQGSEYNYYTGLDQLVRNESEEELKGFLESPERVFCIMRERHYEYLKERNFPLLCKILTGRVGHRRLVLISNQHAP